MLDSIRFKTQASKCEIATQLAIFLETNTSPDCYDFALPDLLYFEDDFTLLKLRENSRWVALEAQFKALKGLIVEA